jgi:hypothetical protein
MCVEDLKSPWFHPTMVSGRLINSFDRKDVERDAWQIYLYIYAKPNLVHSITNNFKMA